MRKFLSISIVVAIIIGLYISSSQTYEQQSLIPILQKLLAEKPFESVVSLLINIIWSTSSFAGENGYYYFIEFLLRKAAHFTLFGLLATGFFLLLPRNSFRFIWATLLTLFLASLDEIHQFFTGGRTASIQDVLLDMSGALAFLIIAQILTALKAKRRVIKSSK